MAWNQSIQVKIKVTAEGITKLVVAIVLVIPAADRAAAVAASAGNKQT